MPALQFRPENGDIIHVYLDDATTYEPDFDLTFDGTNWTASAISAAVEARLVASGSPYRMPTISEINELGNSSNCDKEWVADYLSTGVSGYLFTSKKSGFTSQKVFLPAVGLIYNTLLDTTEGEYWSSSVYSAEGGSIVHSPLRAEPE